ncbi:unnamed protein product [Auanema sp. JU1783]|nr:unnamed protein product [Auanema sp. JU1783]
MNSFVLSTLLIAFFVGTSSAYPKQQQPQARNGQGDDYWFAYGNNNNYDSTMDTQYETIHQQLKNSNQQTIDDYKSGALNDEQFKTHMYINNYEYEQGVSDLLTSSIQNLVRGVSGSISSTVRPDRQQAITRL